MLGVVSRQRESAVVIREWWGRYRCVALMATSQRLIPPASSTAYDLLFAHRERIRPPVTAMERGLPVPLCRVFSMCAGDNIAVSPLERPSIRCGVDGDDGIVV